MKDRTADLALVTRLKDGETAAVSDLARAFRAKIYQSAFRYMKNHEDSEEVTQDVLLRVQQKIGAFRDDAALSSWIYRITFNTAMSRLRSPKFSRPFEIRLGDRKGAQIAEADGPAPLHEGADWSSLADDALYRTELRTRLGDALKGLPSIYRDPVVLRDVQGLSTREASTLLKLKPQTLKSRLHRGRPILRRHLAECSQGLTLHQEEA